MMRYFFIVLFVALPGLGWYGYHVHTTNDGIRFCVSCHAPSGDFGGKLHGKEFNSFQKGEAGDLSGFHREKQKGMRCTDCHQGITIEGQALNSLSAFINIVKYGVGFFSESAPLRFKVEEMVCIRCHSMKRPTENKGGFHFYDAHLAPFNISCNTCHLSHDGQSEKKFFYLSKEKLIKICKRCHVNIKSRRIISILSHTK